MGRGRSSPDETAEGRMIRALGVPFTQAGLGLGKVRLNRKDGRVGRGRAGWPVALPLVAPDMQISRIRRSRALHRRHAR